MHKKDRHDGTLKHKERRGRTAKHKERKGDPIRGMAENNLYM